MNSIVSYTTHAVLVLRRQVLDGHEEGLVRVVRLAARCTCVLLIDNPLTAKRYRSIESRCGHVLLIDVSSGKCQISLRNVGIERDDGGSVSFSTTAVVNEQLELEPRAILTAKTH